MPEPNIHYTCEVCGEKVSRYLSPSRQRQWPGRFCGRTCAGKWRKGERHPKWTGGRYVDKEGYIYLYKPDHPHANARGWVFEHRLMMEHHLGRILDPKEVIHHENDEPGDNRIENLRLFASQSEHKRHHDAFRTRTNDGRYTLRDAASVR